jgi:uncharacterized DUF497 family protein
MAQWLFVEWLLIWILETTHFEFDWDTGNTTKNAKKHGVEIREVESVFCSGLALPLGEQLNTPGDENRLGIVGPTVTGRILQIAFIIRGGRVRVISARTAHKKERIQYEKILRQITKRI